MVGIEALLPGGQLRRKREARIPGTDFHVYGNGQQINNIGLWEGVLANDIHGAEIDYVSFMPE